MKNVEKMKVILTYFFETYCLNFDKILLQKTNLPLYFDFEKKLEKYVILIIF